MQAFDDLLQKHTKECVKGEFAGPVIGLFPDWGPCSWTINVGNSHTHVGLPEGGFENLVDSLHAQLCKGQGMSWYHDGSQRRDNRNRNRGTGVMATITQLHSSDADIARKNGWTPVIGDEGYGPTVIEITAVGETHVLAKTLTDNGKHPGRSDTEAIWTFSCRDWKRVN